MSNEEMISFILKSRERGRTDEQITRALISVGWQKDRITASFSKITQMKAEGASQQEAPAEPVAAQIVKQPAYSPPTQAQPPSSTQQPPTIQVPSQVTQPPLDAVPGKKPLFSLPKLFAKKDAQPVEAPVEKKPLFAIPKLFGKKEQQDAQAQMPPEQPVMQQPPVQQQVAQPPEQQPQAAIPMQPVVPTQSTAAAAQPLAQQGQVSPVSGIFHYLRIFTANKLLLLATALIVIAVLIGAVYFIVFAKGAAPAAVPVPESYYPSDSQLPPPPGIPPASSPENQGSGNGMENQGSAPTIQDNPPQPPPVAPTAPLPVQLPVQNNPPPSPAPPQEIPITIVPEASAAQPPELVRFVKFTSTGAYSLEKFCFSQNNGTLARVHYKEFFGGGCTGEKPGAEGFENTTFVLSKCFMLPCCIDGPSSAYSRSYDWLECGYAS